jgi:4-hydroxybenzoate polyprenyltransferase
MESATVPSLPRRLANLVRLEHSLFALPYAVVGALLAVDGLPPIVELLWVGVAMVAARARVSAMAGGGGAIYCVAAPPARRQGC